MPSEDQVPKEAPVESPSVMPVVTEVVPENAPKTPPPAAAQTTVKQTTTPVKPQVVQPSAKLPSKQEIKKALEIHRTNALKFVGKPGHNAYQWIKKNILPIETELDKLGGITPELVDKVAKLKVDTTIPKFVAEDRSYKAPPTEE